MSIKYCVYDHPLCDKMVGVVVTTSANKIYVSMQAAGGKRMCTKHCTNSRERALLHTTRRAIITRATIYGPNRPLKRAPAT